MLRKGRFDDVFFVDLPTTTVRREIASIHLKKRDRDPAKFDLPAIARATEGFSGAEIEQAVIAGLYEAFEKKSKLSTGMIVAAARHSPPLSVTMAEKIDALRQWSQGRTVPAD